MQALESCDRLKEYIPLSNALNIYKVTDVIRLEELSLVRAAVTSSNRTRVHYGNMWNRMLENKLYKGKSLVHKVLETSIFYDK